MPINPIRSLAGRVLSTSDDAEEKSLAAYVLGDDPNETEPKLKRSQTGRAVRRQPLMETTMAEAKQPEKITDPAKIDLEAAKSVVRQDEADAKDGIAPDRTEAGIVLTAQSPDKSVATYDPQNVQKAEEAKPEKSKYKSGEEVHDRS